MTASPRIAPHRVWVTRAEPGASRTAARLLALGHEPVVAPLLAVQRIDAGEPDLTNVTGLVFTSTNGVAAWTPPASTLGLPVFAVGDATAQAARRRGFATVTSAAGDVHALASTIGTALGPQAASVRPVLLHPGAEVPAGDLQALVGDAAQIRLWPVYRTVATTVVAPRACGAVLIHSPRAGQALAEAPEALAIVAGAIIVAISEAAARPLAHLAGGRLAIAATPDEQAMFDALSGA